jgi:hypothetical protein
MLFAPARHSFIALATLFVATVSAECFASCVSRPRPILELAQMLTRPLILLANSDTYHPATDTTLEQCCPTFPTQPENVDCHEEVVNGFTSVICSFPANGNTPYAYLVPVTDAPAQRRPFPCLSFPLPSSSPLSPSSLPPSTRRRGRVDTPAQRRARISDQRHHEGYSRRHLLGLRRRWRGRS